MATVIDALVVTLGLDAGDFKKGTAETESSLKKLKDTSEKTTSEMEVAGKHVAEGFSKVRNEVLGIATAFVAASGIKSFIGNITQSDSAIGRLSSALNINVEALSAWEGVARRFGSSSEDIDSAFRNTQKLVTQLKFGIAPEALTRWLPQAGVDMGKFLSTATPLPEKLKMIQAALAKVSSTDAQFLGSQAGYSEKTIQMLRETSSNIESLLSRQQRLNSVNKEDVDLAKQRHVAWADLTDSAEALGRRILNRLSPAVLKIASDFEKWAEANDQLKNQSIDSTIDSIGSAISDMATLATPLLKMVAEGWKNIFGWVHDAATEVREYNEVASKKAEMGIKDNNPLQTATVHAMAWWGDKQAKEYLKNERENLGLKPSGDADRIHLKSRVDGLAESDLGKLIARGEGGYNSVNRGQKGGYKSSAEPLDKMTVAQVMHAQSNGEFNAAGRYQIIKDTLIAAVKEIGLKGTEKFDKSTQDKIFSQYLIMSKQKAIGDYITGKSNDLLGALTAWSKEWASAADPKTGKSRYAGIGGNKASMTIAEEIKALQSTRANILGSNTKTDIKIDTIAIQTQASESKEIASTIGPAVEHYAFASNANNGLN